jgi:hypothetical protein
MHCLTTLAGTLINSYDTAQSSLAGDGWGYLARTVLRLWCRLLYFIHMYSNTSTGPKGAWLSPELVKLAVKVLDAPWEGVPSLESYGMFAALASAPVATLCVAAAPLNHGELRPMLRGPEVDLSQRVADNRSLEEVMLQQVRGGAAAGACMSAELLCVWYSLV